MSLKNVNTILKSDVIQKLIKQSVETATTIKSKEVKMGVVSNCLYENVSSIDDFIKQDVIKDLISQKYDKRINNYSPKNYNKIVSFISKAIKNLNEDVSIDNIISLTKNEIKSVIVNSKNSLNESITSFDYKTSKMLFDVYVAPKIYMTGVKEVELNKIDCPTGVKILVESYFNAHIQRYNTMNISQLNETTDSSMKDLFEFLKPDGILEKIKDLITQVNETYLDLDYSLDNIVSDTKNVSAFIIMKDIYTKVKIKLYADNNILRNFFINTDKTNEKNIDAFVKKYKDDYKSMMVELFSHIESFIKKYDLRDVLNSDGINWKSSTKITQSFIDIIGELNLYHDKSFSKHPDGLTSKKLIFLLEYLGDFLRLQVIRRGEVSSILDAIEELTNYKGDIDDVLDKTSSKIKDQMTHRFLVRLNDSVVKTFITWFNLKFKPYLLSLKDEDAIEIPREDDPFKKQVNKDDALDSVNNSYYVIPIKLIQSIIPMERDETAQVVEEYGQDIKSQNKTA